MSKHYVIALVTLLLSVLVAFGWALAVFYGGISIIPSEVQWHDVTRMLLFCLASFSLFCIATFLPVRSEEHTSELQSRGHLVCRLLLEKKKRLKKPTILLQIIALLMIC